MRLSERRLGHGDLNDCSVEVDRRMLDYLAGLDTELGEMVEGTAGLQCHCWCCVLAMQPLLDTVVLLVHHLWHAIRRQLLHACGEA